jgi:hypothetical protein
VDDVYSSKPQAIQGPSLKRRTFLNGRIRLSKLKLTCWLAIFLLPFLFCFKHPHSVSHQLASLSHDERESLEFLFRSGVAFDSFGYCLFGDKPLSVLVYCKTPSIPEDTLYSYHSRFYSVNKKINQGWETWKKTKHKFQLKNFEIIESRNFIDNNFSAIVLINKKAILATVSSHIEDFRSILGHHITAPLLLEEILKSQNIFGEVLKNHQGLIGTLLGYGRNNAWLYHEKNKIQLIVKKERNSIKKLHTSLAQKKWNTLNKKLQPFSRQQYFNPLFMNFPSFMADLDSDETRILYKKYKEQYQRILNQYKNGDFLEITLNQLTSK